MSNGEPVEGKGINKWKTESAALGVEVKEKVVGYILAALGLVAGLAWNEAVRALIEAVFPGDTNSLLAKFVYAVAVSIIVIVVSLYLTRLNKKRENAVKK